MTRKFTPKLGPCLMVEAGVVREARIVCVDVHNKSGSNDDVLVLVKSMSNISEVMYLFSKEGTQGLSNVRLYDLPEGGVHITDAMVEKAWKAYTAVPKTRDVNGWRVAMRAALQAALA